MIYFTAIETSFKLKSKLAIRNWGLDIIKAEGKNLGDITYVFCSDAYLTEMNQKYLHHDTLTDIITFDYSERGKISGDICISVERVKENAQKFKVGFEVELARVMAHGILHLVGYKDKSFADKQLMREKESAYMMHFPLIR